MSESAQSYPTGHSERCLVFECLEEQSHLLLTGEPPRSRRSWLSLRFRDGGVQQRKRLRLRRPWLWREVAHQGGVADKLASVPTCLQQNRHSRYYKGIRLGFIIGCAGHEFDNYLIARVDR
jgi:hypothetical protein